MLRKAVFLFVLTLALHKVNAQTPITNTDFYKAYVNDFHMVKLAADTGELIEPIMKFLSNDQVSNDLKAAVINAISFEILGKNNTNLFLVHLSIKYRINRKDVISSDKLSASDMMCIGYLLIMDDYFNTKDALFMMKKALDKDPTDHTINLLYRLLEAHKNFADAPCSAISFLDHFGKNKKYSNYMLPDAEEIINTYFIELKQKCN